MNMKQDKVRDKTASMYDQGAIRYGQAGKRELRELTLHPTLTSYYGNLKGKRALDVGCGTGLTSRQLLDCGAAEVMGIDISIREIDLAATIPSARPIDYRIRSVSEDLSDLGTFDLVTAVLSLYYFADAGEMVRAMKNIRRVLKPGGTFIGVVTPFAAYEGYGVTMLSPTGQEGKPIPVRLADFRGNVFLEFEDIYWSQATYHRALCSAGFSVEWLPCQVSNDGVRRYSHDFWRDFIA